MYCKKPFGDAFEEQTADKDEDYTAIKE